MCKPKLFANYYPFEGGVSFMRWLPPTALLISLMILTACGVKKTPEELWNTSQAAAQEQDYNTSIKALETLVAKYPEDPLAARAQFQIGDIYMNNLAALDDALEAYQRSFELYSDTNEGVKALFMIGYLNANHLNDLDAAREAYQKFLDRYPDHELAPSVKFELENLGKTIEEIESLEPITNAS
jgi:TolA-binding protein